MYKLGTLKLGVQRVDGEYEEITVNPTKEEQVITASSGKDAISKVTIAGVTNEIDDNIKAENIKKDVEILGIVGTLGAGKPSQTKTAKPSRSEQTIKADDGFELESVTIEPINLQTKTIKPTAENQTLNADEEFDGLESVIVEAVEPSEYYKEEETATITPTASEQVIKPTENKVFSEVKVEAIPSEYEIPTIYDGETSVTPSKETQTLVTNGKKITSDIVVGSIPSEYIVPSGTKEISTNGTHNVEEYESVNVNVPDVPAVLQEKTATENGEVVADTGFDGLSKVTVNVPQPTGTIEITANGIQNVKDYESANVNVQPNLATKEITANGTYNASDDGVDGYSSVDVNVPTPDLSQTTATADDVLDGKEFFNASGEKVAGTYKDMLQARVDVNNSCQYLFHYYEGDNIDFAKNLDVSRVTKASRMFEYSNIQNLPKEWDLSGVKEAVAMFSHSTTKAPEEWDFSGLENANGLYSYWSGTGELRVYARNATNFQNLIYYAQKVTKIDLVDTPKATTFGGAFRDATKLETVEGMNCVSVTNSTNLLTTFYSCYKLTNLTIKNVRVSLQIGSGASWGHLLTLDSLLNTIKELWTNTGTSTLTLTMGTANTAKLADVYVKLIDITDEMRAEDEYIDNKAPFVQCESTDEGAMLVTEYVTTVKNWQLA